MATQSIESVASEFIAVPRAGRMRARSRLRVVLLGAAALLVLWPVVAWGAARMLIVKKEMPAADAIVVLSGSATYVERTSWAAKLYRENKAPLVIVTDEKLLSPWSEAEQRNPFFYELAVRELERQGVPAQSIQIVSDIGAGTFQECARIRAVANQQGLHRLLLVTSGYHTRRALWSITHAAETNLDFGVDGPPAGWLTPAPSTWWTSRWGWKMVAGEYVKLVYYRLQY
jgi:uncharacterized SAM-binding protein YcdF (DUF218 family)